jgi:hypothetical protein
MRPRNLANLMLILSKTSKRIRNETMEPGGLETGLQKNTVAWNGVEEEETATKFKLEDGTEKKGSY